MINQFAKGPQLDCKDESLLKDFEPENDTDNLSKLIKPFLIGCVALGILTQIILKSLGQIGEQKSQTSEITNPTEFQIERYEMDDLLNINFFVNISTEGIQKNMDCFVNKNKETCLVIGQQKCKIENSDPSPQYKECLLEAYKQIYGDGSLEYCQYGFSAQSGIYKETEMNNFDLDQIDVSDHLTQVLDE